jgi:predicted transcriptional regulator
MDSSEVGLLVAEMEAVKKLLILQLVKQGVRQKDIAQVLGVSEATLSRMMPRTAPSKPKSAGGTDDGST